MQSIKKFHLLLSAAGIPDDYRPHMFGCGYHITYFGKKGKPKDEQGTAYGPGFGAVCSAIETPGSYGSKDDRIEISGLLTEDEYKHDSVVGGLTAEDVFERIKKHWESEQE